MHPASSKPRPYHCKEWEEKLILSDTLNPVKDLHLGKCTKFPEFRNMDSQVMDQL
jgi:hypothetical protein